MSLGKIIVETEAEAPASDSSTSEFKLVLGKMADLQEEMKHIKTELKRVGGKTFATKPLARPFVTRQKSAFDQLTEVCEGSPAHTWTNDLENDDANGITMEVPSFDGRNVDAFAETFGLFFVLTGTTMAKSRVKANLIVQSFKDRDLQHQVCKVLKTSTSLEDFLGNLQKLYPHIEMDLSVTGEIRMVQHVPYDPKP